MSREQEFGAGCAVGDVRRGGLDDAVGQPPVRLCAFRQTSQSWLLVNRRRLFNVSLTLRSDTSTIKTRRLSRESGKTHGPVWGR